MPALVICSQKSSSNSLLLLSISMNFTPFIVVVVILLTVNLDNVSAKNRYCVAVWYYASQCEGNCWIQELFYSMPLWEFMVIKWKIDFYGKSHPYIIKIRFCVLKKLVIYFTGFGYPTTHDELGSLPSAFIERVARKLGEKGRSADSAILPFLCYTFVPKCRINGDVSNIRPCRDACDKLEV